MGISVSEVAAVLNVLVIFIQFTLPLFVALIAVAIVENTNNAATWSVFGQLINSTKWPSLLRTDSASNRRVSKRIIYLSLVATIASVLIAVVSAIAPLGLHSDSYATRPEPVAFSYVHDGSAIGGATGATGDYTVNRRCGYWIDINCPGSYGGYITFSNSTGYYANVAPGVKNPYIDTSVASNITDAFTSATGGSGNTLSSVFDIRYRSYFNYANATKPGKKEETQWINRGKPTTMGVPRFFQSMIMDDKIEAIEGLVVDMVNGGVGFRNHTLPPASPYGTTWAEDLLWIEPDTVCVDLNVTLDYTLAAPFDIGKQAINPRLTDRGGIVYAKPDDVSFIDFEIGQSEPQLSNRAYIGAVGTLANIVTASKKINATHKLGDIYPLIANGLSQFLPDQVSLMQFSDSNTSFTMPGPIEITDPLKFNLNSTTEYADTWLYTQAYGGGDLVDINTIHVTTGLMLGAASEVDANWRPLRPAPKVPNIAPSSHWSQPLFSCASALKASIKTVNFRMEGEALVSSLQVEKIAPREYAAGETPTWAVENAGLMISDFAPYWGLVSSEYAGSSHLQTFKSDRLYLPANVESINAVGGTWGMPSTDSNAGGRLATAALVTAWTTQDDGTTTGGVPDYSGRSSLPMFQKWANLSSDASTVGKIIALAWTDLMANGAVGAKGLLSTSDGSSATSADHTVVVYDQGVQYDWVYAIPGFFLILLWLLLLLIALVLLCTQRISIGLLRYMLNQTSAGRAVTAERYGHRDENAAPTRYWADTIGSEQVRVIKQVPQSSLGYEGVENIEMITHTPKVN